MISSRGRSNVRHAAAAIIALACAASGTSGEKLPLNLEWAASTVWDDGLAEVSVYDAKRMIYGKPRPHTLRVILVKEEFDVRALVKSDPPYEGKETTTVLKLNLVSSVPTDNYPYNFLASIFMDRFDVTRLVKATMSSQEWCGNTFKEVIPQGGSWQLHYHSYFDGEADGSRTVEAGAGFLLEEQILVAARAAALAAGESASFKVAESLLTNRASGLVFRDAALSGGHVELVETPLGSFEARRLDLTIEGGGSARYWVGQDPERILVKVENSGGFEMVLRERSRRDYWTRK